MPEWLCQICWIQTKTFHNFYKRIEIRHANYRPIDLASTQIKQEQSVSPEPEFDIVKCEEIELPEQLSDLFNSQEEYSDLKHSNDDSSCKQSNFFVRKLYRSK